jgi:hypothetical protein
VLHGNNDRKLDNGWATTSRTISAKVISGMRRRVVAVARVAWPRLGISSWKAGQAFRRTDGGHDKDMYSIKKLWLLKFQGIHDQSQHEGYHHRQVR